MKTSIGSSKERWRSLIRQSGSRFLCSFWMLSVMLAAAPPAWSQDLSQGRAQEGPLPQSAPTAGSTIEICSFSSSRSDAPFSTAIGTLGYGQLRASLMNPANFGPAGIVKATVNIRAGVATLTAANLAGCDVFFTSRFSGALSGTEATALNAAVQGGMILLMDADSGGAEQGAVNSALTAIGAAGRSVGPNTTCPAQTPTEGLISSSNTPITNGPFGDLRGQTFATSATAITTKVAADVTLVSCGGTAGRVEIAKGALSATSGRVMFGGDPSAFDLFTTAGGGFLTPITKRCT